MGFSFVSAPASLRAREAACFDSMRSVLPMANSGAHPQHIPWRLWPGGSDLG